MEVHTFLYVSIAFAALGLIQGVLIMRNSYTLGSDDFASFIGSLTFVWMVYSAYYAVAKAPSVAVALYAISGLAVAVATVVFVLIRFRQLNIEKVGENKFRFPKKFVWFGQVVPGIGVLWGVSLLAFLPNH